MEEGMMRRLIPSFILRQARANQLAGSLAAWVLNVDLRGFTALTHHLMLKSEAGAEVLTDVINAIFTPAIRAIEQRGGFISGFAGDAFTAVFPAGEATPLSEIEVCRQALAAALEIRDFFIRQGLQKTEYGEYKVSAKLGVARGAVQWKIIPDKKQSVWWFSGEGIALAIRAQELASPNQLVVEQAVLSLVEDKHLSHKNLDGRFLILEQAEFPPVPALKKPAQLSQKAFVPQQILELKQEGEFREVLSCFINLAAPQDQHIENIHRLCAKYGAYFNKVDCTDKGWLALVLFGAPIAYEKTSQRALQFARELSGSLGKSVRIGLSRGRAFAGFMGSRSRGEYTALGMAVNLGARYMYQAEWGEVWFDRFILEDTIAGIVYEDLGAIQFKGFPYAIPTFRLTSLDKAEASLYHSSFVGREAELEELLASCAPLFEGRFAGVSYVLGEPGQGKSRLVYELQRKLGDRVQSFVLPADSIHRTALNPFAYWIRQQFTSLSAAAIEERRKDFRRRWKEFTSSLKTREAETLIGELERIESVLAGLIGLDWADSIYASLEARYRPSVTGFALKSLLEACCRQQPVLLVIEDLQWLDRESSEAIQIITRRAGNIPFKLVLTSRSLDDGSYPSIKLDDEVSSSTLMLCGLSQNQVQSFMADLLGREIATELASYVQSLAQGNPFIVEQLSYYLKESGQLRLQDDAWQLDEQTGKLPAGVQALLVARLDRLEAELKRTVQTASVLGQEFYVVILSEMLEILEERPSGLNELIVRSQLHAGEQEHIWNQLSEIRYIFSHSLLRETAYAMLLKKSLRNLHLLAAQIMQKHFAEDKTKLAEMAQHYHIAEDWENAVDYYFRAGDQEKESLHYSLCLSYYRSALELVLAHRGAKHPDTATGYDKLGLVHSRTSDYEQALDCLERGLAIRREVLGEAHPDTASSLHNIGIVHEDKGDYDKALSYYEQALAIRKQAWGEQHPDTAKTLNSIGNVWRSKGDLDTALGYHRQALEIYRKALGKRHPDTASTLNNIGVVHTYKGEYRQALDYYEQALDIRREVLGDRHPDTASSFNNIGMVCYNLGDRDKALSFYEQALELYTRVLGEQHPNTASTLNNIGMIHGDKGDHDKALGYYERAVAVFREVLGSRHPNVAHCLNNIGNTHWYKGDLDQALDYYLQALAIRKEVLGERHPHTAISLNNIGEVYYAQGDYANARRYSEQALSIKIEALGEQHPSTITTLRNLADTCDQLGDPERAAAYRARAERKPGQ